MIKYEVSGLFSIDLEIIKSTFSCLDKRTSWKWI